MIRSVIQYARDECGVRVREVVFGSEVLLAFLTGVAVFYWGARWQASEIRPTEAATAVLTYAAIALGFCLSGMALVLTLPNESFVKWLSTESHPSKNEKRDHYSDLLFVFSWTAVVHWILIGASVFLLFGGNRREDLLTGDDDLRWRFLVSLFSSLLVYGFCQFLLTVLALNQVGRLYVRNIRKGQKE